MYVPYREESQVKLSLKIPWDNNTAKGFGISLCILLLLLLFITQVKNLFPKETAIEKNLIPMELLNYGNGDGTGMSKGNLSREGAMHKGSKLSSDLQDASIAAKFSKSKNNVIDDPENYQNLKPAGDLASQSKNNNPQTGNASKDIGSPTGNPNATGTGQKGTGFGAGEGYGNIEWGGGGNRSVLFKKLPKYPPGINTETQIRIRFVVSQDGTVTKMIPLQKGGEPSLERAALEALRLWRFNPLKDNIEMSGIITFTFKLN